MDVTKIKQLLKLRSGRAMRRGWRCPDEIQLAAYVARPGLSADREQIEAHVADCDFCLSQVAFLTQSADWENSVDVPPGLLSEARNLVPRKSGRISNWNWRWSATAAAVACLVLLSVVIALQLRRQETVTRPSDDLVALDTSPEPIVSAETTTPSPAPAEPNQQVSKAKPTQTAVVRSTAAEELFSKLITPRDGAVLRREDLEFKWYPLSDVIFYEVRVMTADGDIVFEEQTERTRFKPGSSAPLAPATKYFVVVRAHLRQGKAAKSKVVSFQLAEQ